MSSDTTALAILGIAGTAIPLATGEQDINCTTPTNINPPTTEDVTGKPNITIAQATTYHTYMSSRVSLEAQCKHLQAVQKQAKTNLIISLVQYLASLYFADKQFEIQKQQQTRLDAIYNQESDWANVQRNQWKDNYQQCEASWVTEVCTRQKEVVNYTAIANRINALVENQFSPLYDQIDCIPLHCIGARCDAQRKLEIEKAKVKSALINQEYRKEEDRVRLVNAQLDETKYKVFGLGRGYIAGALGALAGAKAAAKLAGDINPYESLGAQIGFMGQEIKNYYATNSLVEAANQPLQFQQYQWQQPQNQWLLDYINNQRKATPAVTPANVAN